MSKYMAKRLVQLIILILLGTVLTSGQVEAKGKKASLAKAKITLSEKKYIYDGKQKKPDVVVKLGKKKLKKTRDYTVKYSSNKKPGKANVIVKAKKGKKSKYKGTKKATFLIEKASRTIVLQRSSYTMIEGDGSFQVMAKPSAGSGIITYSCANADVIKVTGTGKVTIAKKFDRTCKNLSKETKQTIKKATAKIDVRIAENAYYKGASASIYVTVNKRPARTVNSANSIKTYQYPQLDYACDIKKLTDMKWSIVSKYRLPGLAATADDDWIKEYVQCNNLCPQGICMAGDYMLTTAYCMDRIHNSCIFIYNKKTGAYLRTLVLKDQTTHVGGITYDSKSQNVWVCHAKRDSKTGLFSLQKITYKQLVQYAAGKKSYILSNKASLYKIPTKPSSISYSEKDDCIWVAQFSNSANKSEWEEENEEDVEEGATNEAKMYAYRYKDDKLVPVRYIINTATEDYLGIRTVDDEVEVQEEGAQEPKKEKVVRVDAVYRASGVLQNEQLKKRDILYKVNGQRIESGKQLEELLAGYKEGDTLTVEIHRKITKQEVVSEAALQVLKDKAVLGPRGEVVFRAIPDYVQGVTFTKTGKTIFSCSYRRNSTRKPVLSQLLIYGETEEDNPFGLGEIQQAITLPPMVEEVEMVGDELYMIFESAATTYLEGTDGKGKSINPIDQIVSINFKSD